MDNLENVEDLTFLWNFDETEDDLRVQLLRVTNELEQARKEKIEKEKLNMENVKKLIYLLEFAYKERDELKHQLRTLSMVKGYNKPCACSLPTTTMTTTATNTFTSLPNKLEQTNIGSIVGRVQTDSNVCNLTSSPSITLPTNQGSVIGQIQTNSNACNLTSNPSITVPTNQQHFGTNHLSPNHTAIFPTMSSQSPLMMVNNNANLSKSKVNDSSMANSSSSMDSIFDVVSFSDVSYLGNSDNLMNCTNSSYDPSVLDNLVQGKTKPEKGKLLQSVIEAGPTLDSLLVAGPLPEWSNPPQLAYDPQLPPVPVSMSKRPRHNETLEY